MKFYAQAFAASLLFMIWVAAIGFCLNQATGSGLVLATVLVAAGLAVAAKLAD